MNKRAYDHYRENSVYTSTPEELIMMMYNGLIKFIMMGVKGIDDDDLQKANDCLIRAQRIVVEMQSSLDGKYDVSESLWLMYDYIYRRLVEANTSKDKEILEEVLGLVKGI